MKILVTGGAGFIGSHVVQRLLGAGHEVAIIDELNDFYSPALKEANLAAIRHTGPVDFHRASICESDRVLALFRQLEPDAVIHLAARAGVRPSLEDPLLYEHVNIRGTYTLLEACRLTGVKRFVFASSSSVYGIGNTVPFTEEESANLPVSPYAATKIAGEKICFTYSHLYGISAICLRFFTVYGPRQRPDLAIRKFTDMIFRGEAIPVFGDGSSGRDYTYVDDTVDGIVAALSLDTPFDIFNLGNAHPVDLTTLISTIEGALGKQALIRRLPLQAGDVPITYADISKAKRVLGYSPSTPFEEGVGNFVRWYLDRQAAAHAAGGAV
jgi:UDP-glucuronate 4-epimerase